MPEPDFRESIYQFLFLHEFLNAFGGLTNFRIDIPTLRAEGGSKKTKALGYDAVIKDNWVGFALYYQFKMPLHRTQKMKAEESVGIHAPYWSFHIRKRTQHNALVSLRATGGRVYYVIPLFTTGLYARGVAANVRRDSAWIAPRLGHLIAKTDTSDHQYRYWPASPSHKARFYSEPLPASAGSLDDLEELITNRRLPLRPIGEIVEDSLLVLAEAGALKGPQRISIPFGNVRSTTMENFQHYVAALRRLEISLMLFLEQPAPPALTKQGEHEVSRSEESARMADAHEVP